MDVKQTFKFQMIKNCHSLDHSGVVTKRFWVQILTTTGNNEKDENKENVVGTDSFKNCHPLDIRF